MNILGIIFLAKPIKLANLYKTLGLIFLLILFMFRIVVSWLIGFFGYSIMQMMIYVKIMKHQKELFKD